MSDHEIPAGMRPDAGEHWPPQELIDSFLGNFDFEFRPGEGVDIADTEEAQAAARKFRDTLGRYASGVTVITSMADGEPVGMTCQSFSSISLDPPLVMFSPARTSRAWPLIQRSGHFCVNFLADGQEALSNVMASRGTDKFAGVEFALSATGSPRFDGIVGYVDCTIEAVHVAGDHYVVIGRVQDLDFTTDADGVSPDPLLYFQGAYRTVK
ncbi:flavin reductase family protein [Nocardioides sp. AE5]|uniref:flavin reductase family protein n=1 Tax=Nocardioides sp. AE5 TaxID=2962573 RepID=UPI0028820A26|nr:flavin reductase family protein [Nocardioides sp. AE5]MDT0201604.1 flavin reductase family protein [Nocardioides sp. AE5]